MKNVLWKTRVSNMIARKNYYSHFHPLDFYIQSSNRQTPKISAEQFLSMSCVCASPKNCRGKRHNLLNVFVLITIDSNRKEKVESWKKKKIGKKDRIKCVRRRLSQLLENGDIRSSAERRGGKSAARALWWMIDCWHKFHFWRFFSIIFTESF